MLRRAWKHVLTCRLSLTAGALAVLALSSSPATGLGQLNVRWDSVNEIGVAGMPASIAISPHNANHIFLGGDMMGFAHSTDAGESWESSTGFTNWESNDYTFDPDNANTVWVGTLGGPFKSTNGGTTYTAKRTGFPATSFSTPYSVPIQKICFDPINHNTMLAFAGAYRYRNYGEDALRPGTVWKSTNRGDNWSQIAVVGDAAIGTTGDNKGVNIQAAGFAYNSSSTVYACTYQTTNGGGGVWKSTNGGSNWVQKKHWPVQYRCSVHSPSPHQRRYSLGDHE